MIEGVILSVHYPGLHLDFPNLNYVVHEVFSKIPSFQSFKLVASNSIDVQVLLLNGAKISISSRFPLTVENTEYVNDRCKLCPVDEYDIHDKEGRGVAPCALTLLPDGSPDICIPLPSSGENALTILPRGQRCEGCTKQGQPCNNLSRKKYNGIVFCHYHK